MSRCIHHSSEQTGPDRNQVIRSPGLSSSLTSTNKAPLTFSDFLKPPHQLGTKRSDTGQTQESMGTLDTQCGPNRLTYHVSICSEMEVQHYLIFLPMGFFTVAVTCRSCLGVSGHVSCPAHSDTPITGCQPRPMDIFSKWALQSCLGLWSVLEVLNGPT